MRSYYYRCFVSTQIKHHISRLHHRPHLHMIPAIQQSINLKRAKCLYMHQPQNAAVTSFNIWLPRNVIYSKKEIIKQQNDVKRYIEHHDIDSNHSTQDEKETI
eukprot:39997_1